MPAIRSEKSVPTTLPFTTIKPAPKEPKKERKGIRKSVYFYDKKLIVALVLKVWQANPDWESIASAMKNKTKSKTYDTWRQGVYPSLISGKPWSKSASESSWSTEEKISLVMHVIQSIKINWADIQSVYPDRTKAQLYDVWRQGIVPKLKQGEAIA